MTVCGISMFSTPISNRMLVCSRISRTRIFNSCGFNKQYIIWNVSGGMKAQNRKRTVDMILQQLAQGLATRYAAVVILYYVF